MQFKPNVDSFVERVAKNISENNCDRFYIHKISLSDCFVLIIALAWEIVHNSVIVQSTANLCRKHCKLLSRGNDPFFN